MKNSHLIRVLVLMGWLMAACQPGAEPLPPSPAAEQPQRTPTLPPSPTITLPPPATVMPQPTATPVPTSAGLVVFYSERDGDAEIYLMHPDGSEQHPITDNDADDTSPTWSPDGRRIVFESDRDDPHPHTCFPNCNYNLYVMNADGSNQRRLTSLPGAEWHAAWSPDGSSLVFTAGDLGYTTMGIYTLSLDGGEPQPLLVDAFENDAADWSPDGMQLAFSSNREGSRDIFVMNADGSGIRKVVDTGLADYFPAWSPDGTQLAFFAADFPTTRQDIFTVSLDGENLLNLTNTPAVVDEDPQWSPDGTQILFQSDRDGNFEIYVMNADGSQSQNLTDHRGRDYWPEWWAPGGSTPASLPASRIAFVSTRDGSGNGEIYTTNLDGSDPQRLTDWPQWDGFPDWSPDGRQIAYYSYLSEDHWAIMIMNADGSEPRQLTSGESCDGAPHWSPDGAFITYDSGSCTGDQRDIFRIPVAGGDPLNLSNHPDDDMLAAWSPDGSQLAFTSDRDGNYEIYLMATDGSNVRRLTDDPAEDHAPAWSPDGTRIAFYSDRDGNAEIYVMDADGSNPVNLTNHPSDDWFPRWSPDGSQITFSAWRDGGLEIYVMYADGSNVRRLTDSPGENFNSVWQPTPVALTLSGPYLGQTPPGLSPDVFAPGFISLASSIEYAASFSPDSTALYFTRRIGDRQNLYATYQVDGSWSQPSPLDFSAGYEAHEPHLTLDNATLYFGWFRPVPEGESSTMDYGIWAVDRIVGGWSVPRYVGQGMFVSSDLSSQLYITHQPTSAPAVAQVTLTEGRFTDYERITSGAHPAIAPDGSYLVYDRQGSNHLWVRFRMPDGAWGDAKELTWQGAPQNAQIASISPDGLYLFFTDGHELYWVSTEIITALR